MIPAVSEGEPDVGSGKDIRSKERTREAGGYEIRTVHELLGHKDVKTTMIYTHVLNRGPAGVRSPVDRLRGN
jgi:integrase